MGPDKVPLARPPPTQGGPLGITRADAALTLFKRSRSYNDCYTRCTDL